jgi:site-specific DNA-methyltransferase (adenine-specific)
MIEILNTDCMQYMKGLEDNAFDLAIVDPPYGININKQSGFGSLNKDKDKNWDNEPPKKEYFNELIRTSANQIIWGANYFFSHLNSTKCCISWDKMNGTNDMADFELAWTSFDKPARRFSLHHFSHGYGSKIHPTQKPVKLYEWILSNYAKEGDRILDTHLGSGSSAIAAHYGGFDLVGCELDEDYFKAAQARFDKETAQLDIFQ